MGTLVLSSCGTTPEYIYVQPECSVAPRKALPEIDAGVLYSILELPHRVPLQDLPTLIPELPEGYDGNTMYYDLLEREKNIVDMLLENEATLNKICKKQE